MKAYVEFEISEGAYELSCPDALCNGQGIVSLAEIAQLVTSNLVAKHHRYRLNRGLYHQMFEQDFYYINVFSGNRSGIRQESSVVSQSKLRNNLFRWSDR